MKVYCNVINELYCEMTENGLNVGENGYVPLEFSLSAEDCFKAEGLKLLEVDVDKDDVLVGEGSFDLEEELFEKSFIPLMQFRLGSYRHPVCRITKDIPGESFRETEGLRIYESSEKYYVTCLMREMTEKYDNFGEFALRSCFEALAKQGKMEKIVRRDYIIFKDESGKLYPMPKNI